MPLIAGPGALDHDDPAHQPATPATSPALIGIHLVMVAVLALTYVLVPRSAAWSSALLGQTGIVVLTRLFGILLAALSVQFVLERPARLGLLAGLSR